jgi:hypothetical protein
MLREKLVARRTNMIVDSFSNSVSNDHELLGVDHEQTPKSQATTLDAGSSSTMLLRRGGVPLEWDPFTRKYLA